MAFLILMAVVSDLVSAGENVSENGEDVVIRNHKDGQGKVKSEKIHILT